MSAIIEIPGSANIQRHLRNNLRVLKAAYEVSGDDLPKAVHWVRTEQLSALGHKTAEQEVAAGKADDVIRLIGSLHAGASG